jgi:hypothetical protein
VYEKVVGKGKKKEYPHLQNQTKERAERKPLNMETSERVEKVLLQEAEAEVRTFLQSLQPLKEGDLKGLEQQIMASVFRMGRRWMEQMLTASDAEAKEPAARTGACGHVQQLVGYRPRQLLTLLGKVSFKRAYYQCCLPADEAADEQKAEAQSQPACTHGEAPADARWGLQGQRTTAGVRASGELSVRHLDAGGSRQQFQPPAALRDVSPPGAHAVATGGGSAARARRGADAEALATS